MTQQVLHLSCEFFPPKTEAGFEKLLTTAQSLKSIEPELFSVTFGAGGSTQENTLRAIRDLKTLNLVPIAPHLTCIASTKESIRELIELYKEEQFHHIVALRGDLPNGMIDPGIFKYANELIQFIRQECGDLFTIYCGAYPEMHPEANNIEEDFTHLINKFDMGANGAITQYFFNADSYLYLRDHLLKKGIKHPLIAGIMPITNFTQLARFSDMCGAEIPKWLYQKLECLKDDLEAVRIFGEEVISSMCQRLIKEGVSHFHFYTLNNASPTLNIVQHLK